MAALSQLKLILLVLLGASFNHRAAGSRLRGALGHGNFVLRGLSQSEESSAEDDTAEPVVSVITGTVRVMVINGAGAKQIYLFDCDNGADRLLVLGIQDMEAVESDFNGETVQAAGIISGQGLVVILTQQLQLPSPPSPPQPPSPPGPPPSPPPPSPSPHPPSPSPDPPSPSPDPPSIPSPPSPSPSPPSPSPAPPSRSTPPSPSPDPPSPSPRPPTPSPPSPWSFSSPSPRPSPPRASPPSSPRQQPVVSSLPSRTGSVGVTSTLADYSASQYAMTSITLIINLCGRTNPDTIASVSNRWWGYNKAQSTLQEYWQQCSLGKVTMDPARNIIVGPIDIGCSGTASNGLAWSASQCEYNDIFGVLKEAEDWATNQGHDLSRYTHSIVSIIAPPSAPGCGASWGVQNCANGGRCAIWMVGGISRVGIDGVMHELGHNLNLQHTARNGYEYMDLSDLMGLGPGQFCFSAPSMWMAGWGRPISGGDLTESNFPTGEWRTFTLPSLITAASNHVRFNYNSYASWFISFRSPVGYDTGLSWDYQMKISLHRYAGENRMGGTTKPNLLDVVGLGQQSKRSDSKLFIKEHQCGDCHGVPLVQLGQRVPVSECP